MPYPVYRYYRQTIGNSMPTLDRCPCLALTFLFLFAVTTLIAYGCRIDQKFRPT